MEGVHGRCMRWCMGGAWGVHEEVHGGVHREVHGEVHEKVHGTLKAPTLRIRCRRILLLDLEDCMVGGGVMGWR